MKLNKIRKTLEGIVVTIAISLLSCSNYEINPVINSTINPTKPITSTEKQKQESQEEKIIEYDVDFPEYTGHVRISSDQTKVELTAKYNGHGEGWFAEFKSDGKRPHGIMGMDFDNDGLDGIHLVGGKYDPEAASTNFYAIGGYEKDENGKWKKSGKDVFTYEMFLEAKKLVEKALAERPDKTGEKR